MSRIPEFPQPMVEAPAVRSKYFYDADGKVDELTWVDDSTDRKALRAGNCYATREEAQRRCEWNAQEMARLVVPLWFRKLGPDVEVDVSLPWAVAPDWRAFADRETPKDWAQQNQNRYRSKLRDVVVTVNGKEYRWPQTVTKGETSGVRFNLAFETGVYSRTESDDFGPTVHHTRAGAEQQLAAIKAAAGESL